MECGRLNARELHAWQTFFWMQEELRRQIEQQLQECGGLSMADYTVLAALSEAADQQLRTFELVELLGWEKSRVHHQVTRMTQRGLVERRSVGPRAVAISMTDEGRAVLDQAASHHSAHVRQMVIDALDPDQLDQLAAISTAILDNLSAGEPETKR